MTAKKKLERAETHKEQKQRQRRERQEESLAIEQVRREVMPFAEPDPELLIVLGEGT
jgi:hypothetical protein